MSDWTSNEAKEFLSIIRGEAEKVVKDFGDRQSSVYSCLAVVTAIPASGDISVRLLSSPADGSQDFVVRNRSGSTLEVGDSVWLHYWSDYTNVYIAMRNAGGDVLALPYDAVSSNLLINGGFDIWQRGTSFASGYTADRWRIDFDGTGATRNISRQAFTAGQTDVPSNPTYFLRFYQSAAGSGSTYNVIRQCVENVSLLSGAIVTLSFYAKATSPINVLSYGSQVFGTGGSAEAGVASVVHSIGTTWTKFVHTFSFPSIAGKTIGAHNFTYFGFSLPINTTFTFNIANVQLNYGSVALPLVQRLVGDEVRLSERYAAPLRVYRQVRMSSVQANYIDFDLPISCTMRTTPTISGAVFSIFNMAGLGQTGFTFSIAAGSTGGLRLRATKNSHGLTDAYAEVSTAGVLDAEL